MSKKDQLKLILKDFKHATEFEEYLIKNSNLPGRRTNLELAFAFSETNINFNLIESWLEISEDQAGVNDPQSFFVFCACCNLGPIFNNSKNNHYINLLFQKSNDKRWRIREAVDFGFQYILETNYELGFNFFQNNMKSASNYVKRAILVTMAHPKILS